MITDHRVFDDAHLPRQLMHREAEVEHLCRLLEPALDGEEADDVVVAGPSGVGKTTLASHTLQRVEGRADVRHAHVRCLGMSTGNILRETIRQHPRARQRKIHRSTRVRQLRSYIEEVTTSPFILILDEADGLEEAGAVDALQRVSNCSLIVVTHNPNEWLSRFGSLEPGRLFGGPIELDRYRVDELADILDARARGGLLDGVVGRGQLERIADDAAGVARRGIKALEAAAELANERAHETIRDEDVADSFARARRRIRRANLRSLPFHHHVLYAIIHAAGSIDATELHNQYDLRSGYIYEGTDITPITRRSRRNKLAKLREYDLIEAEGEPQARGYSVLDDGVEPLVECKTVPGDDAGKGSEQLTSPY